MRKSKTYPLMAFPTFSPALAMLYEYVCVGVVERGEK